MTLPITSLLAAAFALFMVALSVPVSLRRIALRTEVFTGTKDETLRRRIRAHGNFTEYAPTALIVVGLIEFAGGPALLVTGIAVAFFASRILHAFGMLYSSTPALRALSMAIQHCAFVVAAVWLIGAAL